MPFNCAGSMQPAKGRLRWTYRVRTKRHEAAVPGASAVPPWLLGRCSSRERRCQTAAERKRSNSGGPGGEGSSAIASLLLEETADGGNGRASAGHVENGAGDVGGVAQEPDRRLRDFLRRARAGRSGRGFGCGRVRRARVDVRLDEAGTEGVDPHALRAKLLRKADGQGVDRALRAGLVDIEVRRAEPRRGRRHQYDGTAAPPANSDIRRAARAPSDRRQHVDLEDAPHAIPKVCGAISSRRNSGFRFLRDDGAPLY